MPSAPPTSRVVSFTADPTPALFIGRLVMIDVVDDGIAHPTPAVTNTIPLSGTR